MTTATAARSSRKILNIAFVWAEKTEVGTVVIKYQSAKSMAVMTMIFS